MFAINALKNHDTVLQRARCSFDAHIQEILGSLIFGASLVMVHPGGILDFQYLIEILERKQITLIDAVPSFLHTLFMFIKEHKAKAALRYLRSVIIGGMSSIFSIRSRACFLLVLHFIGEDFPTQLLLLLTDMLPDSCQTWNMYGPAEATIQCAVYLAETDTKADSVPIGLPLSNYHCFIKDHFFQDVIINQEGELFVGGVGVFAGYLGRDDLSAKALVDIDGEMFYRTGDLVRLDSNGLLHYIGRTDHQVKLHGQRIELGEIEKCLLNITSIPGCVVMKWNDDHLVAYVQSSSVSEDELRSHCQSHLPPHMVPSFFVILDKLPLNANGKIDRKQLPQPCVPSRVTTNLVDGLVDRQSASNHIEIIIHHIWCDVLQLNHIPINTDLFTIGGHSLLIIRLFHRYTTEFGAEINVLRVTDLFKHPTIAGHAQLIHQSLSNPQNIDNYRWFSLHLVEGN